MEEGEFKVLARQCQGRPPRVISMNFKPSAKLISMRLTAWLRGLFAPLRGDARATASRNSALEDETYEDDDETLEDAETHADEDDFDPFNPFPEPVRLEIVDVFDLHTIAPRDVERVVEEYLLEARRAGFASVRLIHGKGIGVQRETVRRILARTPFVQHFSDAPPEAGGWGATIAHLRQE